MIQEFEGFIIEFIPNGNISLTFNLVCFMMLRIKIVVYTGMPDVCLLTYVLLLYLVCSSVFWQCYSTGYIQQ